MYVLFLDDLIILGGTDHRINVCVDFAVAFRYRATLISHVPNPVRSLFPRLGSYTPLSTFESQASAGLTSESFDIEANIRDGDSRAGLDEQGTQEVLDIMRRERVK